MSLAGPPLASFLRGCTARLALADALVVMGNEASTGLPAHGEARPALTLPRQAADADSIISSIAQAYVSTHLRGTPACPYLPIDRKALRGRRETVTLLAEAGVDAGDLLTVDDLRPDQLPAACGFVLTDHNFPSALFAGIEERVVEIIDHHHDAGQCPHVAGDARRVAFDNEKGSGIGSTCTLIAEELLRHPAHARDPLLSRLLLGVILVDTVNMSKAAKRATERDVAAVRALEADIAASLAPWSPTQSTALFDRLNSAKFDPDYWRALAPSEQLGMDYKQRERAGLRYGLSAVLIPFDVALASAGDPFWTQCQDFMDERRIDLLGVLTFVVSPAPARELVLCARGGGSGLPDARWAALLGRMASAESLGLDEVARHTRGPLRAVHWRQRVVTSSRKQVMPALDEALDATAEVAAATEGVQSTL